MDGAPGKEIGEAYNRFGDVRGALNLVRFDGTDLPGWPVDPGVSTVLSGATLADLDGDGIPELLAAPAGWMFALRRDGTPLPGWPVPLDRTLERSVSPAAVGDLTGDGVPEVVLGTQDGKLYLWSAAGERLAAMPVHPRTAIDATPSLADLDGDGMLEIAVNTSITGAYVLERDGTVLDGWPRAIDDSMAGASSLAIGDVDGDGALELAVGTGLRPFVNVARMYLWRADGRSVPGWPQEIPHFNFNTTPVIADLDGDGQPDVAVAGNTARFDAIARIYAWHADGTPLDGFPLVVPDSFEILAARGMAVTDLDGDGDVDLLLGTSAGFGCGFCPARVFAFDLPAPYDPSTVHWATVAHDFQRTGLYTPPDARPVADAGPDRQVACASPSGAVVTLDGSASYDPDEDDAIVTYAWFADLGLPTEVLLGTGVVLDVELPLGAHEITLQVTDGPGARGMDTIVVTVQDTVAPSPAVAADPAELWPPNHRMVEVAVALSATDACDPDPVVSLVSVTSSEADEAPGPEDGETAGDVAGADLGTADDSLWLRAERSGSGPGRTYELRYEATDAAGNVTPALAVVHVPHDQGNRPAEPDLWVEQDLMGNVRLLWPAVEDAAGYDVIRGERSELAVMGSSILLGPVTVLARADGRDHAAARRGRPRPTPRPGGVLPPPVPDRIRRERLRPRVAPLAAPPDLLHGRLPLG